MLKTIIFSAFFYCFLSCSSAMALEFNFTYQNGHQQAFTPSPELIQASKEAAAVWQDKLNDDVTINVQVIYSATVAFASAEPVMSQGAAKVGQVYKALQQDATSAQDRIAIVNLPKLKGDAKQRHLTITRDYGSKTQPTKEQHNMLLLGRPLMKALGLRPAHQEGIDIKLYISSKPNWDYTPENGIELGHYDLVGTMAHELAHGLGFMSGVGGAFYKYRPRLGQAVMFASVMDLFRYNNRATKRPQWELTLGGAPYLSINGGKDAVAPLANGIDFQSSHWRDNLAHFNQQELGIMDPKVHRSAKMSVSAQDLTVLDVIGWDRS